jgi:hypothetical protein
VLGYNSGGLADSWTGQARRIGPLSSRSKNMCRKEGSGKDSDPNGSKGLHLNGGIGVPDEADTSSLYTEQIKKSVK